MSRADLSHRRRSPRGLTLVEVLVVMTVVAVLLGVLLPAVQQAREAARRSQCASNLRQAGLALHQFEGVHGWFPPGAALGPLPEAGIAMATRHGPWTFVLPFLERQDLFDLYRWDAEFFDPVNHTVVGTHLSSLQCPAAEPARVVDARHAQGAFGGAGSGAAACADYAPVARVNPLLGMLGLVDQGATQGVLAMNTMCRFADILDGTSTTILAAEAAGRPGLRRSGRIVPDGFAPGGPWASNANAVTVWGAGDDGKTMLGSCAFNCSNYRQPYSLHPGGGNFLFADGSVRFLKESISLRLLARLTTRAGGEPVGSGDW